ncbi:hypothetical protein [Streptomyces sp. 8N616]|uniref:hypothetical protein n=1 Tax=Streptomyces sp. 8N616 TaxID=3457414 RepID=UPI003FD44BA0
MTRIPQDPPSHVDELLAALDPLPYPQRMRELAARARKSAESGQLSPLLDELARRGAYGQRLAVVAAAVGGDAGYLEARLADPDAVVRGHALRAAESAPVSDGALEAALEDAPAALRRELVRVIVGRGPGSGRTALAERLIGPYRERWGDREAARLLPGCGAGTVARLLPELFHAAGGLRGLAARHPDAVLDEAGRQLAGLPEALRETWWQRYAPTVAATVHARPDRVLELLERGGTGPLAGPLWHCLGPLTDAAPGRTLRLLLDPRHAEALRGRGLPASVLSRLARHEPALPEFDALGRAWAPYPELLAALLRALPPARRSRFYDTVTAGRGLADDPVPDSVLDLLPRSRREAEGRRLARLAREREGVGGAAGEREANEREVGEREAGEREVGEREAGERGAGEREVGERGAVGLAVLAAVAHLPVDEAWDDLVAATRRPAADDRAEAWALLIRNAARSASGDPAALSRLLREMERLRNEHDPVRSAALTALRSVQPGRFTDDDAPYLDRIAADAIQSRDSSFATRRALSELAVGLLRAHAATAERQLIGWALRTLVRLSGNTGGADLGRLDRSLRRGQEHEVFEALRPWLEAGAEKVDHGLTFALARAVGPRRAAGMPELQELLWQAVQFGNDATVRTAIDLWLEDPRTRDERVGRILALDSSAAVLEPVLSVLTRRRTDLLDAVLASTPPHGRFRYPGGHWLPPVGRYVDRWLPRQQAAAARLMTRAMGDASLQPHQRTAALRQGALIPELGAAAVRRWTDSPDVQLAEAALAALAWTDRPGEAMAMLLERVGDDRARVAAYAATRASRYVEPSRLSGMLRGVLVAGVRGAGAGSAGKGGAGEGAGASASAGGAGGSGVKVTSRKEAARLAATRLPVSEAAALLAEAYELPGQHRDVRAACVAFAARLLGDERAWDMAASAATGAPVLRQAVLRTGPLDLPEHQRARYARLVTAASDTDDREVAESAYGALARWAPWSPDAAGVLAAAVTDLDNRGTWRAAADGLVSLATSVEGAAAALGGVLGALVAADAGAYAGAGAGAGMRAGAGAYPAPVGPYADAGAGRDRPARRRVEHLVERLAVRAVVRPDGARAVAVETAELLARHGGFVPSAARLLVDALDLDAGPAALGEQLSGLARLHEGRPALAERTSAALRVRLDDARASGTDAGLREVASRLAGDGTHAAGLFAVALTTAGGDRSGWSEPWRDLLRALRRHPTPDVSDAALTAQTAEE